jgi:hypothetical protein
MENMVLLVYLDLQVLQVTQHRKVVELDLECLVTEDQLDCLELLDCQEKEVQTEKEGQRALLVFQAYLEILELQVHQEVRDSVVCLVKMDYLAHRGEVSRKQN